MKVAKRLQEYLKYTPKELETYIRTEGSCVCKVNTNLHFSLGPYSLANFKQALKKHIVERKVGYYDVRLNGIILDIKNIKVLGRDFALRADDWHVHVNINADCYLFRPKIGAELSGIVKHVGSHHVGVIIYRVFNASIRFDCKINFEEIQLDQEFKFRIKNFNLQNVFPYIAGELLTSENNQCMKKENSISIKTEIESITDSGIEEKDNNELDDLITVMNQQTSELNTSVKIEGVKTKKARKSKSVQSSDESPPRKKTSTNKSDTTNKGSKKRKVSIADVSDHIKQEREDAT